MYAEFARLSIFCSLDARFVFAPACALSSLPQPSRGTHCPMSQTPPIVPSIALCHRHHRWFLFPNNQYCGYLNATLFTTNATTTHNTEEYMTGTNTPHPNLSTAGPPRTMMATVPPAGGVDSACEHHEERRSGNGKGQGKGNGSHWFSDVIMRYDTSNRTHQLPAHNVTRLG